MSDELHIRRDGRAGRITLTRPDERNRLTAGCCREIREALERWQGDDAVSLIVIDAEGDFCAGRDLGEFLRHAREGGAETAAEVLRCEYRLADRIAQPSKPIVSFLSGRVAGTGVALGCFAQRRVVGNGSRIVFDGCATGLIPDTGGTYLLARAPARLGEYFGLAGVSAGPGDAVCGRLADAFVPEKDWPDLIDELCRTGRLRTVDEAAYPAPDAPLLYACQALDEVFALGTVPEMLAALEAEATEDDSEAALAAEAAASIRCAAPLSMDWTLATVRDLRSSGGSVRDALDLEFRFMRRAAEDQARLDALQTVHSGGDQPAWPHTLGAVPDEALAKMRAPLGRDALMLPEWDEMVVGG
ncbi:enoyl-CoA hydratase/isomerase family protein [Tropicimonas sp. IMCC34011]|uniref:enoyl-CoA hydratase/isomerase family protein n=1 Tax=Tropicimonas sp. IMCC34011 TaxID=2248759 RepID=UPI000E288F15|nr:enoyl-CoA hydratase/isomerase family protein [Tropicimonas sp. IMCC34011]